MFGNELIISEGYSAVASVHTPCRRERKWYVRILRRLKRLLKRLLKG